VESRQMGRFGTTNRAQSSKPASHHYNNCRDPIPIFDTIPRAQSRLLIRALIWFISRVLVNLPAMSDNYDGGPLDGPCRVWSSIRSAASVPKRYVHGLSR
jgi:hypothetical protein